MKFYQLFTAVLLLIFLSIAQAEQYIVVVDAGSSGSRAYIYRADTAEDNKLVNLKELNNLKIEPGISSIATTQSPEFVQHYLSPLLQFVESQIPEQKQQSTSFYWYSTAGMRLVAPVNQQNIYGMVKDYINNQTPYTVSEIKTITGTEEGAYMWLASNYTDLKNNKSSHGIIDMGGASTQIAFQVNDEQTSNITISFPGKIINLFSYSFLGLGRNELQHQFANNPNCYQKNFILPNGTKAVGNYENCMEDIYKLMKRIHLVSKHVDKVPDRRFQAYDGFESFADRNSLNKHYSRKALANLGHRMCANNWNSEDDTYKANPYNYLNCIQAAHFNALLLAYDFDKNQKINARADVSWTKGVAAVAANNGSIVPKN